MSNILRLLSAIAYDGFARNVHTMVPGGHRLRARLAGLLCVDVAMSSSIEPGVHLSRGLVVRDGAGIGAGTWFLGAGRITLGCRLKMGPQCMFITNDHPIPPDGQTFSDVPISLKEIVVGDDVFLGARTVILPGVHIGDGVAVGAGSVVARDLPAGAIAVGAPAKVLRLRDVG